MPFIKYILIFFILGATIQIGNILSKKYINRVLELEQMNNMLNIFKSKIKFTCLTLQEIYNQIYEDNKNNIGKIFKNASEKMNDNEASMAWNLALDEAIETTSLTKEDIDNLKNLGKMLGNTNIEGQISQIELTEHLLKEQIKEAQEEKRKNAKLYKTLGVTTGLALAIILMWRCYGKCRDVK